MPVSRAAVSLVEHVCIAVVFVCITAWLIRAAAWTSEEAIHAISPPIADSAQHSAYLAPGKYAIRVITPPSLFSLSATVYLISADEAETGDLPMTVNHDGTIIVDVSSVAP